MSQSFTAGVHPDPRHAGEAQDHSLLEARGLGYALFELVRDSAGRLLHPLAAAGLAAGLVLMYFTSLLISV